MNKPENYDHQFNRRVMYLEGLDIMAEDVNVDFQLPERKALYDPMSLPMRTHEIFMKQARYLEHLRENECTRIAQNVSKVLGVTIMPVLSSSLQVPTAPSFSSIDFMHFVSDNAMYFVQFIWTTPLDEDAPPLLLEIQQGQIDKILDSFCVVPSNRQRKPRALFRDTPGLSSYKNSEWFHFFLYLSPVFMGHFLPRAHFDGWMHFVDICRLAVKKKLAECFIVMR